MANPGVTDELYGGFNFLLEIEGVVDDTANIVGGFKSISGMNSETEVTDFKQGNDVRVRKRPGRTTYSNIVLERGYTAKTRRSPGRRSRSRRRGRAWPQGSG